MRLSAALSEKQLPGGAIEGEGRLVASCREITGLTDARAISESIPRLAMGLCGARSARLLRYAADGSASVVSAHGLRLEAPLSEGSALRVALRPPEKSAARLVLLLETETGAAFLSEQIDALQIFAFVASSALTRANAEAAMHATRAVESAVMSAVRDAVIVLDPDGVIRAVSGSFEAFIPHQGKEAVGKRLRDIPGLGPLAVALAARERCPETVKLGSREVKLRLRRCEAGLTVTLFTAQPAAAAPSSSYAGDAHFAIDDMLGQSPHILRARETVQRVADSHLPILITGETGTGKEILAQSIHNASGRSKRPFVGVNLSAIPRELLESELFGYEAGAFTGASSQGHPGKFELAQNGTLLLDEIGDMPLEMQAKLLRVLQERTVQRLGGARSEPFSGRVIASTNRDLEQEVREGRFRLDLLHRLRVVHVALPPLRERGGDMRLVVAHHLGLLAQRTARPAIAVAPHVMAAMESYPWPGNLRELVNVLDCEVALLPPGKDVIDAIPAAIERRACARSEERGEGEAFTLETAEREACARALQKAEGNVARAAVILQVAKATLYSKMRQYGLMQPRAPRAAAAPAAKDR